MDDEIKTGYCADGVGRYSHAAAHRHQFDPRGFADHGPGRQEWSKLDLAIAHQVKVLARYEARAALGEAKAIKRVAGLQEFIARLRAEQRALAR